MSDPFAKFRAEIDQAIWVFIQPGATVTTNFFGRVKEVTIAEVNRETRSQTGIMVKLKGMENLGWFDAAWFKPVKKDSL